MLNKLDLTYLFFVPFLLSAILSLKSFWLKWPKHLRIFSIFLCVTLTIETLGNIWKWDFFRVFQSSKHNIWILNAGMIVGRGILLIYFYHLLSSVRLKRVISYLIPLYFFVGLINYFFIQTPQAANTYSVIPGSVLVVFLCIFHFIELAGAREVVKFTKLPEFWISTGTFIYYLASIPFIIGFDFLVQQEEAPYIIARFMGYNDYFLFTMYTLYLIAYICRPHPKSQYKPSLFPH